MARIRSFLPITSQAQNFLQQLRQRLLLLGSQRGQIDLLLLT